MLALAREDWKKFITTGGFQVDLTFTSPVPFAPQNVITVDGHQVITWDGRILVTINSNTSLTIQGIYAKHHNSIATDGTPVNSKLTRISFAESSLILANYPVRNTNGEVSMLRHKIDFVDSTGILKHYIIKETFPDETVGVITCILGDYGN
ncbi:MAG: hypothetical protein PHW73_00980 [Atribacterota bacterium]|nr:hypothetical protein [Atribacterota bacterium]